MSDLIKEAAEQSVSYDYNKQSDDSVGKGALLVLLVYDYMTPCEFNSEYKRMSSTMKHPENRLSDSTEAKAEKEAASVLKPLMPYIENSAKANDIPPELIASQILAMLSMKSDSRFCKLYDGLVQTFNRQNHPHLGKFIFDNEKFLRFLNKIAFTNDQSAFFGGVIGGFEPTIGVCRIRSKNVYTLNTFERFGIHLNRDANRKINMLLLDPKYNIETFAVVFRQWINKGIKRQETYETSRNDGHNSYFYPYKMPNLKEFGYSSVLLSHYHPFIGPKWIIQDMFNAGLGFWHLGGAFYPEIAPNWTAGSICSTDYKFPMEYVPIAFDLVIKTGLFKK